MFFLFFFNDTATTEIYTLSLHDALPIYSDFVAGCIGGSAQPNASAQVLAGAERFQASCACPPPNRRWPLMREARSEEHTSELQSLRHLVCRLLLEKKNEEKLKQVRHRIP